MATRDAQDILDVKAGPGRPKKKAPKQKAVRPAHIPKEVWLLETQGDRTPPVSLTLPQPKQPKFTRKVKPWEWQAFTNPNRADGLILHHWRKRINPIEKPDTAPATPAEGTAGAAEQEKAATGAAVTTEPEPQRDATWAKYNIKVDVPKYTESEYKARLESDEWSKEETDYLMGLAEDFDLRWIVIADRYDFSPSSSEAAEEDAMAVAPAVKPRTMEDMKARYYNIAAIMMDVRMGLSNMTTAEYNLHEKMTKYDPFKETRRKRMAEQLLQRTDEEIEEERRLLIELKRIIQEEDDFIRERTELFERLNAPASRQSISQFESAQGLMNLMQNLLVQDKARNRSAAMMQRRSIAGVEEARTNTSATPVTATGRGPESRKSLDSTAGGSERRKDSKSGHNHTPSFVQRQLTARDEHKYGVQRPDKLLTGEKIRHLRIEKRVTARASSVAAKVQDSMVELGIPIKPVMATGRVVAGYEELCTSLDALLDLRRHSEKTENEIKILKAKNDIKDGNGDDREAGEDDSQKEGGETISGQEAKDDQQLDPDAADTRDDGNDDDDDADGDGDGDGDGEEEEDEEEGDEEAVRHQSDEEEDEEAGDDTPMADVEEEEEEEEDGNDGGDAGDDGAGENEAESRPSTRASGRSGGRKRSVSVLSSAPSQKSTKRQRK